MRIVGEYLKRGVVVESPAKLTFVEMVTLYRQHAQRYYVKDGKPAT